MKNDPAKLEVSNDSTPEIGVVEDVGEAVPIRPRVGEGLQPREFSPARRRETLAVEPGRKPAVEAHGAVRSPRGAGARITGEHHRRRS